MATPTDSSAATQSNNDSGLVPPPSRPVTGNSSVHENVFTPRSSVTVFDRTNTLDEEAREEEARIEKYGADDPREPVPKTSPSSEKSEPQTPAPLFSLPKPDPNQVTWDGPQDPENPQSWSVRRKWGITVLAAIMSVNVTFASSAPTSATMSIIKEFGIQREISYLLTTLFLLGYVFGPILWGPGSEVVGRRPVLVLTMICYTLFILGQALAQNIETLLITRFLSGFFAAAPMSIAGGIIADIWDAAGRGPATSMFSASVFIGPVLGPIVCGAIADSTISWRWTFWVMMIFAGACTCITVVLLPETYAPVLLYKKVKRIRKSDPEGSKDLFAEHEKQDWSLNGVIHRVLYRPFQMLAVEPILLLVTFYLSLVYGLLYALFQAFPIIFVQKRGFSILQDGLIFIGVGIGTTIGAYLNYYTSRHYPELIKKWHGFPPAEQRLFGGMIGGPLLVIGCFWLGWTGNYPSVPWYVPALATIVLGTSISMIFMSFLSYLIDTYLMYAASAFAANMIIRSAVAAAFPLFTVQMFTKLGVNWACTLLGLVALVLAPSPFLFYKYGPRVRQYSKFAPCIDLKIKKAMEEREKSGQA